MSANDEGEADVLYHFALSTGDINFKASFGDVKFVLCGGSATRMLKMAEHIAQSLSIVPNYDGPLKNLSNTDRYVLYKVGPILCVNHGIGIGSCQIMLHEITKLLRHSGVKDPIYIRVGTCGGLGLNGGKIVASRNALSGNLEFGFHTYHAGKRVVYDCDLDKGLISEIKTTCKELQVEFFETNTMTSNDFYEEQGRCDGALCSFTEKERMDFLKKCCSMGIQNFDMECACFGAFCKRAGIRAAVVCVTLLDRLQGDQLREPKSTYEGYEMKLVNVITETLKRLLRNEKY